MGKVRSSGSNGKRNNGIVKLKLVMERLLLLAKTKKWPSVSESYNAHQMVPKDVKEGHFAVIAISDDGNFDERRRFVVPIAYLRHPLFVRLLERAAEEYGFDHEGALMIPCRPSELEWMLHSGHHQPQSQDWTSCHNSTMVVDTC